MEMTTCLGTLSYSPIIPPIRRVIIGITIASEKGEPRMLLLSPKLTWFCTRVPKHSRTWGVHHLHGRNKKSNCDRFGLSCCVLHHSGIIAQLSSKNHTCLILISNDTMVLQRIFKSFINQNMIRPICFL